MYVLAWPVQQFSMLLIEPFWLSMLAAFLVTTALGYGTWHGFEKSVCADPSTRQSARSAGKDPAS
jgi:peptidoglycan/LPS O-acetylase OafA/YrhL